MPPANPRPLAVPLVVVHAPRRFDYRPVAGAAAQVRGQRIVDFPAVRFTARFVQREQRHDETRGTEPALRCVAVDHGLLHRVQQPARFAQALHRKQEFAVQSGKKLDAGIHGTELQPASVTGFTNDHGARPAVSFRAALLGAGAAQVFPQVLQNGSGRIGDLGRNDLAIQHETDSVPPDILFIVQIHAINCRGRLNNSTATPEAVRDDGHPSPW